MSPKPDPDFRLSIRTLSHHGVRGVFLLNRDFKEGVDRFRSLSPSLCSRLVLESRRDSSTDREVYVWTNLCVKRTRDPGTESVFLVEPHDLLHGSPVSSLSWVTYGETGKSTLGPSGPSVSVFVPVRDPSVKGLFKDGVLSLSPEGTGRTGTVDLRSGVYSSVIKILK